MFIKKCEYIYTPADFFNCLSLSEKLYLDCGVLEKEAF